MKKIKYILSKKKCINIYINIKEQKSIQTILLVIIYINLSFKFLSQHLSFLKIMEIFSFLN